MFPQAQVHRRDPQAVLLGVEQVPRLLDEGPQLLELRPVQGEPRAVGEHHPALTGRERREELHERDHLGTHAHGNAQVEPVGALVTAISGGVAVGDAEMVIETELDDRFALGLLVLRRVALDGHLHLGTPRELGQEAGGDGDQFGTRVRLRRGERAAATHLNHQAGWSQLRGEIVDECLLGRRVTERIPVGGHFRLGQVHDAGRQGHPMLGTEPRHHLEPWRHRLGQLHSLGGLHRDFASQRREKVGGETRYVRGGNPNG